MVSNMTTSHDTTRMSAIAADCQRRVAGRHRAADVPVRAVDRTVWTVNMFESATVYQSALRNTIEYEQALYLANAGVHHAVAELENDLAWRGTVTAGSYPASGSYSATAVNGATAGTVDITSTGVAGGTTRRLSATVLVN